MTQPLKHIVINGKYLSAPQTGVHRVATELANALGRLAAEQHPALDGVALSAWIPRNIGRTRDDLTVRARVISGSGGNWWEQVRLPFAMRGALLLNLCNIGPLACRHAVTMIHDAQVRITPRSYSLPFRIKYALFQPLLSRRNHKILTVSEHSRREIARAGICAEDKIAVVHNGVDHVLRAAGSSATLDRLGLTPQRYVLALANTQVHKNIGLLIRAFALPALADLTLVLVGRGTAERFARAGTPPGPNVRFTGWIPDADMRGLMERALCFAFPSTTEGFGLPPLEAMILGCPAVVAPCGAIPEICGDAVRYALPDDPAAWAAAISALAGAPAARAELVERGRARAATFTWRAAALRLMAELRPFL